MSCGWDNNRGDDVDFLATSPAFLNEVPCVTANAIVPFCHINTQCSGMQAVWQGKEVSKRVLNLGTR